MIWNVYDGDGWQKRLILLFLEISYIVVEDRNNNDEKTRFGDFVSSVLREDEMTRINYFILYVLVEAENFYHFTTVNGRAVQRPEW